MVLENKVALICGAGGMHGIGRAIALKLASLGADVALADVKRAPHDLPDEEVKAGWKGVESVCDEVKQLGRSSAPFYCDITRENEVEELIANVLKRFGGLHILVNNARAIVGPTVVPLVDLDVEDWDHLMAVNLRGMFLCCKHGARALLKQNAGGRIINMGSDSGKRGVRNQAAYCASKFGVNGLTQSLALELTDYGITVNAICPDTDTHRLNYRERRLAQEAGISLDEMRNRLLSNVAKTIPLGRVGMPEDVAALASFLVSPEAGYITGQSINVSGGLIM